MFHTGIKVTFEHFGWISPDENAEGKSTSWNEREDDYSSVVFWYQTGRSTFLARAPGGAARRLTSLERALVPARDFADASHHGTGATEKQRLDFYEGEQLLYKPETPEGAWLEIPIRVTVKEPLRLVLNATKSYDFGR